MTKMKNQMSIKISGHQVIIIYTQKVNINIDIKTIAGPEEKVDLFPTLHAINLNFLLIFYLKMSAEEWKETFFCRNDVLQPI